MKHQFLIFLLTPFVAFAQNDSILLDEVILSDFDHLRYQNSRFVQTLGDSILRKNNRSLTELLNQETLIYFKENGLGMVSSVSFRGTTAQQTAVIWNGININSLLLGQSDFNVINPYSADQILISAGGNSLGNGTGAIGGSIQLNNEFSFENRFSNQILLAYGSFNTINARYQTNYSHKNLDLKFSYARNQSDNDYDLPNGKNLNGKFYANSYDFAAATKINTNHILKFYSSLNDVDRHFSLTQPSETPTKYKDFNTRSLIEWNYKKNAWNSNFKTAYVTENYRYYPYKYADTYTTGKSSNFVAKYDLMYNFDTKKSLNFVAEYNHQSGEGDEILKTKRDIIGGTLRWKHLIGEKLTYDLSFRQDYTKYYDNPFLYSLGINYRFSDFYNLRFNTSKNYRIPTYNDLFWAGSGNPNLEPETSKQVELGNDFKVKNFTFNLNFYYNRLKNMIQWQPINGSFWEPRNIGNVEIYGLEFFAKWQKQIGHHQIKTNLMYGYNESKNIETDKNLIYTPNHKANLNLAYQYKRIGFAYQINYVGDVYTTSDNLSRYSLDSYWISNVNVDYYIDQEKKYQINFGIRNLFDQEYQVVESRFMPGINYNVSININF